MANHKGRLNILAAGCLLLVSGFIGRLAYLQTWRRDYYQTIAASQRQQAAELSPRRGAIYIKERGNDEVFPAAVNTKKFFAYAVPRDMPDPLHVARELAPALLNYRQRQQARIEQILSATGQTRHHADEQPTAIPSAIPSVPPDIQLAALTEELYNKFNRRADPYESFLKFYETLDDELTKFLEEKHLPGIMLEERIVRTYPEKSLAAHALGFVGWENEQQVGRYGIEEFFENKLRGRLGFFAAERDAQGRPIIVSGRHLQPAENGADIVLTLDRVVQSLIEKELADGVQRYGAERGSAIVMDPSTGAVLGMATYPSFDPNYYYAIANADVQRNPILAELFEPGSILKPIIMATAIDAGKVTPHTTMVDSGPVRVAEYTINTYDGRHYGVQTMTQILEQSNNVGMVWVAQQLGAEMMYDYLRRFGIGERTGIELAGETQSTLPQPGDWNVTTVATTAYGQGIALTPLQALNAINAIANGGLLPQPHIVDSLRLSDGRQQPADHRTVRRVVEPGTAANITAMMVSVIENGVAQLARVPGYYLAGKTGTAQVPDEKGGYSPDRKIISFAGFGPVSSPRFSILIKLDNPAGLSFASGTAAPMFRNIAAKLLNYYQIPPDYDRQNKPPRFTVDRQAAG